MFKEGILTRKSLHNYFIPFWSFNYAFNVELFGGLVRKIN